MPYPSIIFSTIEEWEAYLNSEIVINGNESITGLVGNNAYNGAVTFIKKSPLNWSKAAIYSDGGDISLSNNFLGVAVFMTTSPDSLTFGDNFYNQYVLMNMTSSAIPLAGGLVYYDMSGNPLSSIPANAVTVVYKGANDLWIVGTGSSGSGTVTSVGLSMPSIFSVANSPITTAGTLAVTFTTQLANRIFAGPTSGLAAIPTFRALVAADIPALTGSYWGLTGNSGTTSGTNFLGTTDDEPLTFKVNNILAGYVGTYTEGGGATSFGIEANGLGTGANTAFGFRALRQNTGTASTAFGMGAMQDNKTAFRGVAFGYFANWQGWGGEQNAWGGDFSGELNSSGSFNSAWGGNSMRSNKEGSFHAALGFFSLLQNTTNVASVPISTPGVGYTDGTFPLVISAPEAGSPGGISIQAVGTVTISGGQAISTAITTNGAGYSTEKSVVTASYSDGLGTGMTFSVVLQSGNRNIGIGYASGAFNRTGSDNIFLGYESGMGLSNAAPSYIDEKSIFIGRGASRSVAVPATTSLSNAIAIGYNSKVGANNTGALGGTGSDAVNWGINTSTARQKLDVVGGDVLIHELTLGRGPSGKVTATVFGFEAGQSNLSGLDYGTYIGWNTGKGVTTQFIQTAIGAQALLVGGGNFDVAIGANTLKTATTGSGDNTGVGYGALFNLTTGLSNFSGGGSSGFGLTTGSFNITIGSGSLGKGLNGSGTVGATGSQNIYIGNNAGYANAASSGNIGIGFQALLSNSPVTGRNIALGYSAGSSITSGDYNVIIGGNTGASIATLSNHILLADGQGNERMRFNNTAALSFDAGSNYGTSGFVLNSTGPTSAPSWVDVNTLVQVTLTNAVTLTNKRITQRVTTITSSATPTPDGDASDMFTVTALATNTVFAAPTGTPTNGQPLLIRIKDSGGPWTIGWNAIYRTGTDFSLPATTVAGETMYVQFVYNSADSVWDAVGLTQGF